MSSSGKDLKIDESTSKAVYIWSEELKKHSNDFILEILEAEGFDRLILTAGRSASMEKAYDLQRRARERGMTVEFLLAPNYWVRSGDAQDVRERLANLDLRGSPLHLDIEPQIYDDFEEKEGTYLRRYLEVLRQADRILEDSKLMVSVPFFWPAETYPKIAQVVDRAYVMVYGEKSISVRTEHARDAIQYFSPDQRAIALRPEDFPSPSALSRAIPILKSSLQVDDFAIHDFESVVESAR
ncbi:MAG: hypothetical protein ABEL51_11800 [Salinibacter sp.]